MPKTWPSNLSPNSTCLPLVWYSGVECALSFTPLFFGSFQAVLFKTTNNERIMSVYMKFNLSVCRNLLRTVSWLLPFWDVSWEDGESELQSAQTRCFWMCHSAEMKWTLTLATHCRQSYNSILTWNVSLIYRKSPSFSVSELVNEVFWSTELLLAGCFIVYCTIPCKETENQWQRFETLEPNDHVCH